MKGFLKVAAVTPKVALANPATNVDRIIEAVRVLDQQNVALAVFPEMCISGYTCGDLFHNRVLIDSCARETVRLAKSTRHYKTTFAVGLPIVHDNTMYNVAAVISGGKIYGLVPKTYLPNYNEFYEKRWWASAFDIPQCLVNLGEEESLLSSRQIFNLAGVKFGIEICEDLWAPITPGTRLALGGAEIILNLSASDTLIGKSEYVRKLVEGQSARCICGYVYTSAGQGESSSDLVFSGQRLITCNGRNVSTAAFSLGNKDSDQSADAGDTVLTTGFIDLAAIRHDRLTIGTFCDCSCHNQTVQYVQKTVDIIIDVPTVDEDKELAVLIDPTPFVPGNKEVRAERCEDIIDIQTRGLMQRLEATGCRNLVVGISGGLDSTLALLIAVNAFDRLGYDRKGIHAITMPGFGTTGRTFRNAVDLIERLGTSFRKIDITNAVMLHFSEIGHNPDVKDVTYENSQARQRTLLLMDIANQVSGMVLGTGDLSELALGWATYNGDHISMYGVNAGVPKTLVKYLVEFFIDKFDRAESTPNYQSVAEILRDIVVTPISPELIPADENDNIIQKTEDLVGPYELHDFFLYNMLRFAFTPAMIYERACLAFDEKYDKKTILHWLTVFTRRFFSQQFKRNCLPDGPKVGSVCLSPRGDWRMPADVSASTWLKEIDNITI